MKTYDADNSGLGSAERSEAILAARRQVEAASGRARQAEQMGRPVRVELPKTDSISGYKLLGEVHRGGQGVVYRALQESTRRQVALKVIHGGHLSGEVARLRFERETHILARLEHPNIVTIHDSGSAEGNAYYVMDFVDGSPLDGYVKRTPLSLDETLRLFATVCDAVHEAHVRGIIHRDLKPGNIMVDSRDQPRILDFGLAKLTGEDESSTTPPVTITGQFVGSMPWASPEQAQGRWDDIDVRSDVYSLGVVFYQILTGSFPYPVTGNVRDVVRNIVEVDPRPPGSIRRKFPDEVETILLKCLSKEPGRRYQSAGELARDLRNYLDGQPIDARRDSTWYVLKKTLRRHRVPVAFALLVALFGIAALGGLFVAHKRQTVLRAEAQRQAAIARAVNDFLNRDLLASVKPQEKGRDVTVREVLDEASQRIEKQFPDEPVIEAAVRETLGNTYMELGEWTTALSHAERALALTREQLGDRHRRTLSAMQLVGRLYRRLGRYEEAERALSEMVESARSTLGAEDPLTTQGMNNLAYALAELGRMRDASALNREALEIRTRTLGPEHVETLRSLHNQAYYEAETFGRYVDAERLYGRAYELREKVLGPNHPDTLSSMGNLANMWVGLGRYDDAERLHVERLKRAKATLGERHPMVLRNLGMLGDLYTRQRRYEDAERLLVPLLGFWRERVGDSHREVAETLWRLGDMYVGQERFEEAETAFRRALEIQRATIGRKHQRTHRLTFRLGEFYLGRGQYDRAEEPLVEAANGLEQTFGRDHPEFQAARRALVAMYEAWHAVDPEQGYDAKAAAWRGDDPVAPPAQTIPPREPANESP